MYRWLKSGRNACKEQAALLDVSLVHLQAWSMFHELLSAFAAHVQTGAECPEP